ncbi:MAG TPA: hypothetical protein P5137_07200, partial [Candidatus Brocadiia bacterium]|nr:hypothetical protein [Candidatus Brocadiia bacterium]
QPAPAPLPPGLVCKDAQLVTRRTPHGFYAVNWKRLPSAEAAPALALVIPTANTHLTDCLANLETRFAPYPPSHAVRTSSVLAFDKGFATAAVVMEARALPHEDAYGHGVEHSLLSALAPDGRSFLMWQRAIATRRINIERVDSLNLNIARDIFNDNGYTLATAAGERFVGPGQIDGEAAIPGPWANFSGQLAVLRLAGAEAMTLHMRDARNRAYGTLRVDLLSCSTPVLHPAREGQVLIENAWLFVPGLPAQETPAFHDTCALESRSLEDGARSLRLTLPGDRICEITAGFASPDLPLKMRAQGAW